MIRFSKIQIHLHWITLVLIAGVYAAMELRGWFPRSSFAYALMKTLHYHFGISVWILMFIRIGLKHVYADPPIIPAPPGWQQRLAALMHLVLYLNFLALPVLGIAILSYGDSSWTFLGFTVSPFADPNEERQLLLKDIHETLANTGYFLIALHAGAALYHHLIQRDNTLLRMMPGKSGPTMRP